MHRGGSVIRAEKALLDYAYHAHKATGLRELSISKAGFFRKIRRYYGSALYAARFSHNDIISILHAVWGDYAVLSRSCDNRGAGYHPGNRRSNFGVSADYLNIGKARRLRKLIRNAAHLFLCSAWGYKQGNKQADRLRSRRSRIVAAYVHGKTAKVFIRRCYWICGQHRYPSAKIHRRAVHSHVGGTDHLFTGMGKF